MQKLITPIQRLFVPEKRMDRIAQIVLLILSISYSAFALSVWI